MSPSYFTFLLWQGKTTGFRLTKGFPMGCEWATGECTYFLGIDTDENNNILITLEGKANGWVAVGFSKTPNMVKWKGRVNKYTVANNLK